MEVDGVKARPFYQQYKEMDFRAPPYEPKVQVMTPCDCEWLSSFKASYVADDYWTSCGTISSILLYYNTHGFLQPRQLSLIKELAKHQHKKPVDLQQTVFETLRGNDDRSIALAERKKAQCKMIVTE
jgi:hypothetical protein